EIRWRLGDEERVIGVTAIRATGADGRFLGVLALLSDVSEVRRLEARVALARHLADLGNVSAGAAHEFRNAAAAIDGFADLGRRGFRPGKDLSAILLDQARRNRLRPGHRRADRRAARGHRRGGSPPRRRLAVYPENSVRRRRAVPPRERRDGVTAGFLLG